MPGRSRSTTATIAAGSSCARPCASTWRGSAACASTRAGSSSPRGSARRSTCCAGRCAARGARRIAMENPSLADLWLTVRSWGLELVGVPMDGDGPRLDVLDRLTPIAVRRLAGPPVPERPVMAAGPALGARRLGAPPRSAHHRGRLRRRVPLRPDAHRRRSRASTRARHPCRYGLQGACSRAPDRLAEPARRARRPLVGAPSTSPIPARPRSTSSRWRRLIGSGDHERQVARAFATSIERAATG